MRRCLVYLAICCATALVAIPAAKAGPIVVPSGLHPGDQYRLVFVTNATRNATSTLIADYNTFVSTAANAVPQLAALGTTWTAIASTSTVDARDNTGTNPNISAGVPIYDLADQLVAASNADLWDGSILVGINHKESGAVDAGRSVWSGTQSDGTVLSTLELGSGTVTSNGTSSSPSLSWIENLVNFSSVSEPLYAMSGVLTAVPEPSAMTLAGFAAASLSVLSFRGRRGHKH